MIESQILPLCTLFSLASAWGLHAAVRAWEAGLCPLPPGSEALPPSLRYLILASFFLLFSSLLGRAMFWPRALRYLATYRLALHRVWLLLFCVACYLHFVGVRYLLVGLECDHTTNIVTLVIIVCNILNSPLIAYFGFWSVFITDGKGARSSS